MYSMITPLKAYGQKYRKFLAMTALLLLHTVENIMAKGAHHEQFHLLPQCFQNSSVSRKRFKLSEDC